MSDGVSDPDVSSQIFRIGVMNRRGFRDHSFYVDREFFHPFVLQYLSRTA